MVNKKTNKNNKYAYQVLLVDILIFLLLILVPFFFFTSTLFQNNSTWTEVNAFALFMPCIIFILCAFGFSIYIDYKYNHFEFKKIFVILAALIALINIIAISCLPSEVVFPYSDAPLIITPLARIRGITYGLLIALLPLFYFYILPRKINSKALLKSLLILGLIVLGVIIVISFFTDANNYYYTIKNLFADSSHPVTSIFNHKNFFASGLFCGLIATIWLHILSKNWKYLLLIIPIFIVELFTFAKMPIFVSVLLILSYLIYLIVRVAMKSKDNLVIVCLIFGFVILIGSFVVTMMFKSDTGPLFKLRKIFDSIIEGARTTFSSRTIIWQDTLKLLMPFQYVFGFGFALLGNAIQKTYAADPRCPEDPSHIFHAHNTIIETLGEGGIIYLIINLFLFGYLIYIACKFRKKNSSITFMGILLVILLLILGLTDPVYFLGENFNCAFAVVIILPIMSLYYIELDKEEIKNHKEIVKEEASIKKMKCKNKLELLNKKLIVLEAKFIKKDIKN